MKKKITIDDFCEMLDNMGIEYEREASAVHKTSTYVTLTDAASDEVPIFVFEGETFSYLDVGRR